MWTQNGDAITPAS